MATKKKSGGSGFGLAALAAAAAAGAYFLYGSKDAKKNRKKVQSWALKAKAEVLEKMEQAKGHIEEQDYQAIVDKVMSKYEKLKDVNTAEAKALGKELKTHWKNISKELKPVKKATKKK